VCAGMIGWGGGGGSNLRGSKARRGSYSQSTGGGMQAAATPPSRIQTRQFSFTAEGKRQLKVTRTQQLRS